MSVEEKLAINRAQELYDRMTPEEREDGWRKGVPYSRIARAISDLNAVQQATCLYHLDWLCGYDYMEDDSYYDEDYSAGECDD